MKRQKVRYFEEPMTIQQKIDDFAPVAEMVPGVVVIHDIKGFQPLYMTKNGLNLLKISLNELIGTGENYKRLFLNPDFMEDYLKDLESLLLEDERDETFTFFTQVRYKKEEEFVWYVSSLKVFHRDRDHRPTHTVAVSIPLENFPRTSKRAERLLGEEMFRRRNKEKYASLGEREKEVLQLVSLGKTSAEIANNLHISVDTVNSHRKNIKQKLSISSIYEFSEYTFSFDLI